MIIFITCNPYNLEKPYPKIEFDSGTGNRESIARLSSLWLVQEEPLAESLLPHGDWEGLFPVIESEWGVTEAKIFFVGLREDYCRLQAACEAHSNANPEFRAEIIIDEDIIEDISPLNRRKLLLQFYEQQQKIAVTELSKFNDVWKNCGEILKNKKFTDAEAVVKAQEVLSIFLRSDDVLQQLEKIINELYSRRRPYEVGMEPTLPEAFERVKRLQKFSSELPKKLKDIIRSAEVITSQEILPQHTKSVEIEINGKMKHWVEDIYADLFMKNFRDKAKSYYCKVKNSFIEVWRNKIRRMSADIHDSFINSFITGLQEFSPCSKPDFDVGIVRCTEKYYRPSYWEGNEAHECSRDYIDIFAYESDILSAIKKRLNEDKKLLNSETEKLIKSLNDNIKEYVTILNEIIRLENLKRQIDDLKKILPNLTSINTMIRR